jgi:hypothetical protein
MAYPPNSGNPLQDDTQPGSNDGDMIMADHINSLVSELGVASAITGSTPKGIYSSVADRLDEMDITIDALIAPSVGPAGENGTNGTNGLPGADGIDGIDGTDGVGVIILAIGAAVDPAVPLGTIILRVPA